jgi:4-amino-4-deoxy-L-arabinose transferase-like glycosyltransferase
MSPAERRCLAALTASFVLLGLAFSVIVPMFANYDEHTHLDRVGQTAHHPFRRVDADLRLTYGSVAALEAAGSSDTQGPALWNRAPEERPRYRPFGEYDGGDRQRRNGCPGTCQNFQYAQPPAWYLLVSPVYAVLDSQPFPVLVLGLRAAGVLLTAPVVVLTWWAARQLWPGARRRALAAAALTATAGPLAFTAAGVNNDALMLLTAAAAVALTAAIARRGATAKLSVALGLVMCIGLLTKVELVVIAPVVGLAVLVAPKVALARWKAVALVAVLASPGVLWWVDQQLRGGVLSPEGSEILAPPSDGPWSSANVLGYAAYKVPVLLDRFWGLYGVPAFVATPPWRLLLWLVTEALVIAWLVTRVWRRPSADDRRMLVLALIPLALTAAVIWASFKTYRLNGEVRALAPRYLYAAMPLFALGAVSAAATVARRLDLPGRVRRLLPIAIPLLAAVAGLGSFVRAVHGLYGTTDLSLLLDRAGVLAPVAAPGPWTATILVLWGAAVVAAAISSRDVLRALGPDLRSDVIQVAPRGGPGQGARVRQQPGVRHDAEVDRAG